MVTLLRPIMGTQEACRHVGISRASYYRSRRPAAARPKRRPQNTRRLSEAKRAEIRALLNSERFMDLGRARSGRRSWMKVCTCATGTRCIVSCVKTTRYVSAGVSAFIPGRDRRFELVIFFDVVGGVVARCPKIFCEDLDVVWRND